MSTKEPSMESKLARDGETAANGKIAFVSNRDGTRQIYTINPDGTGLRRLTDPPAPNYSPAWSPDGSQITFISERNAGNPELYRMKADGAEQHRLSDSVGIEEDPAWGAASAAPPTEGNFRISRYVSSRLTEERADEILAEGRRILESVDGANDVRTIVSLRRDGPVTTFSTGDGTIDSAADLRAVFALPGQAKVVNQLSYCGGPAPSAIGCAPVPGRSFVVERLSSVRLEGILWMHEYGHNKGLSHRNVANAVMNGVINSSNTRVNDSEREAFERPRSLFQEEGPPMPKRDHADNSAGKLGVREFAQHIYIEGVNYEEAAAYPPEAAAQLLPLLNDPKQEIYWPTMVAIIGMIGDNRVADELIRFVSAGDGILSPAGYKAKTAVLVHLGDHIHNTQNQAALQYLTEGVVNPSVWSERVAWASPHHDTDHRRNSHLRKMAIWGLALSGQPAAEEPLRLVESRVRVSQDVEDLRVVALLEEALDVHQYIHEHGLREYYRRAKH